MVERVRARGVEIAVIAPDPVETIAALTELHGLGYPVLSDVGGAVVEAYGILNPNIPTDHPKHAPGTPFPGQFLIAADATVAAKAFTGDLRHRASGTALVTEHLGADGSGPRVTVDTDVARIELSLATGRAHHGQEITLTADVEVAEGWHVYGAGVDGGYQPFRIVVDPGADDLIVAQDVTAPPGTAVHLEATGETLAVLTGRFRAQGRIRLRWSPPPSVFPEMAAAVAARQVRPGPRRLRTTVHYQACSDTTCLAPGVVEVELPFEVLDHAPANPAAS